MKEAKNIVTIEGILSEVNLKYGSYQKKDGSGTAETVGGSIKILVPQAENGIPETKEIPVYLFAQKLTRAGKSNPAYVAIERVMNEFTSIAAAGSADKADKVRITSGSIHMNEFVGRDGRVVSTPRINCSFVDKVTGNFNPRAKFQVEGVFNSTRFVTDSEGIEVEPKKMLIQMVVPQYGGNVDVIEFATVLPNAIDFIQQNWEAGCTYAIHGDLNFTSTQEVVAQAAAFGDSVEDIRTRTLNEFLVTGGSEPYDSELAYDIGEIREAIAARKERHERLIAEDKTKSRMAPAPSNTSATSKAGLDLGF